MLTTQLAYMNTYMKYYSAEAKFDWLKNRIFKPEVYK